MSGQGRPNKEIVGKILGGLAASIKEKHEVKTLEHVKLAAKLF